jgi:tetratricopeptide (TPR) repeat protein
MRPLLLLSLLLGACGGNAAHEALTLGHAALAGMRLDEATEHYTEALRHDPSLAEAYLRRGQIRYMAQQHEAAVEDLDRALALDSGLGWASFFRGSSHFALSHFDRALPDLAAAAASTDLPDEDRARAHRMRAIVFMNTDRYAEGADALSASIALRPDLPLAYFERGMLYAELGRREEAIADLEAFLGMDPGENEVTAQARQTLDTLRAPAR